jgi:hypothetical protein
VLDTGAMRSKRVALVARACSSPAALVTGVAASAPAHKPSISLSKPLPSVVRIGERVTVEGHLSGAPRGTLVTLEAKRTGNWRALAQAKVLDGAFKLRWRVPKSAAIGPISWEVVARSRNRVLASTPPTQSGVGPAAVYCTPPPPPTLNIPVGDGWIVGGVYFQGGAYPGILSCVSQPYAITATTSAGAIAATQDVAGGHSYTLVLPAGSYTLTSSFCRGSAVVAPGKQTRADTFCDVP